MELEEVEVRCPTCGEVNEVGFEWNFSGELTQDCWACCRPIHRRVWRDERGDPPIRRSGRSRNYQDPGTTLGKTHLAAGLGVKAIQNGFSVSFASADELIEQLRRDEEAGRRIQRRRALSSAVLVLDELGFQALDRREAHLLFKVIAYRYERSATIITSNKSVQDWPEMLAGDEVLATASLDRLLHHCHVVQIDGKSFRLREMEKKAS